MKRVMLAGLIGTLMVPSWSSAQGTGARPLSLDVMNPRAAIPPPPAIAPNARVQDLSGKRIGIYWIGKPGGDNFFDGLEQLINEKFPTARTVRYKGGFDLGDKRADEVKKEVDAIIYGVGD